MQCKWVFGEVGSSNGKYFCNPCSRFFNIIFIACFITNQFAHVGYLFMHIGYGIQLGRIMGDYYTLNNQYFYNYHSIIAF